MRLQRFLAWWTEDLKARRVEFDDDGSMFIRVGSSSEVLGVSDLQCIVTFMCVLICMCHCVWPDVIDTVSFPLLIPGMCFTGEM